MVFYVEILTGKSNAGRIIISLKNMLGWQEGRPFVFYLIPVN